MLLRLYDPLRLFILDPHFLQFFSDIAVLVFGQALVFLQQLLQGAAAIHPFALHTILFKLHRLYVYFHALVLNQQGLYISLQLLVLPQQLRAA